MQGCRDAWTQGCRCARRHACVCLPACATGDLEFLPQDPHAFVEERMARAKKLAARQQPPRLYMIWGSDNNFTNYNFIPPLIFRNISGQRGVQLEKGGGDI